MTLPLTRTVLALLLVGSAAAGVTTAAAAPASTTGGELWIEVLSGRADLVSGGDALLRVSLPPDASAEDMVIAVDGDPVTSLQAGAGSLTGLVTDLAVGANEVTASLPDGRSARLTVTNHPSGGPVFSGAQVQPWICDNAAGGNGPPQDAQCTTEPIYELMYRAAPRLFLPYDPASPPPQVPTTTTDEGETVPYVVRVESGTMNRGNYLAAVLWDVETDRPTAWNHKLLVPFGASTAVHHKSGAATSVLDDLALGRGFLVANNSLNIHGQNANDVVSAEAVLMLKERIIEQYGAIRFTMGNGCSGGAIQQYMLTSMYPGLLDGIQPACSFTDVFSTAPDVLDCHLLIEYFTNTSPQLWLNERDRTAVTGHRDQSDCAAWEATFSSILDPSTARNCALPQEQVYDASTNPRGVRCTISDYMVGIFGRRPATSWGPVEQQNGQGFAQVAVDTVGIQYGLSALETGAISTEQFVDLNAGVGGITTDDEFIPERIVGDAGGIETVYRTGQISDPRQWATVPIIDLRGYNESVEIHTSYYTYTARARLDNAQGHHDNQLIWTFAPAVPIAPIPTPSIAEKSFLLMDRWLTAIEADTRDVPLESKVVDAKPTDAVDTCFVADQEQDNAVCQELFPPFAVPRTGAGSPPANDIVKCTLVPVQREGYDVSFTDEQWAALQGAFPDGVCDYNQPGVAQVASVPWQTYAAGPGGRALGPAPQSAASRPTLAGNPPDTEVAAGILPATGTASLPVAMAVLLLLAGVAVWRTRS